MNFKVNCACGARATEKTARKKPIDVVFRQKTNHFMTKSLFLCRKCEAPLLLLEERFEVKNGRLQNV